MIEPPTRAQVIQHRLLGMEAHEGARMAERLALIAELDGLGAAQKLGFRSTAHWLQIECRLESRTARDYVRISHRLQVWRSVCEALREGRLTYSQCRALARASAEEDEAALLAVALRSTVTALEVHVRQLQSAPSADPEVAEAAHERRTVQWAWDEDGTLSFWGRLAPADGAAFAEALETGAARIHGCCENGRPRLGTRRADALGEIMRSGCPRTTLQLQQNADGDVLALRDGPAIPAELARRLTCDAMVTVQGLNHGRTVRVITPAQRRALEARDGRKCWMRGCERSHELDGHHIRHWTDGGKTDLDNLVLLCPYHHRLFHEGGWRMTPRGGQVLITNSAGEMVDDRPRPPRIGARRPPKRRRRTQRSVRTRTRLAVDE